MCEGWRRDEGLRNLTASDDLDDVELDGDDVDVLAQGTTLEGCAIDAMMVELAEELVGADND